MSGFGGLFGFDGTPVGEESMQRMAAAGEPRAIDGLAQWHDGTAGLIRLRHASTPQARYGPDFPQTMAGAVLCFDRRIDNRAELLTMLVDASGDRLSDAALVALLLDRFGADTVRRLIGDWAFGLWNPREKDVFLARSATGWRPVMWARHGQHFGFATDPAMLIDGLGLSREPDEAAIGELLAGRFVTEGDTLWAAVKRLPQGCALTARRGDLRIRRWFEGPFEDQSHLSDAEQEEAFRNHFDAALSACMRSSAPVAAQLSGGLDSSSIVCRATELHRAGKLDRSPIAFSARFPGEAQDETRWSTAVEQHLGIRARIMAAQPYDFEAARAWSRETLQLPIRPNVSDVVLPTLHALSREGISVLLTGEGGDEWLAGHYAHFPDFVVRGDWLGLWREAGLQFSTASAPQKLRHAASLGLGPLLSPSRRAAIIRPYVKPGRDVPRWIAADWARSIGLAERWAEAESTIPLPGYAQRQRYGVYAYAQRYIGHESVQAYAERLGVELRHPFHDLRLTRFVMGLPGNALRRGNVRKYLLREAMRGTLPEAVRTRGDKVVFQRAIRDAVAEAGV